jgi:hypothetical protein
VKQRIGSFGIFDGVERLHQPIDGTLADIERPAAQLPLVEEFGVFFLQES